MDRNAWGTPPQIIEMTRDLMGSIDVDPASNAKAQETVKADVWFGLDHPDPCFRNSLSGWCGACGNVWLNPPYGRGMVLPFVTTLLRELNDGRVTQACVLVNATTETEAGQLLLRHADAVWFPDHRIKFLHPETNEPTSGGTHAQMLCYFAPGGDKDIATCDGRDPRDDARRRLMRTLEKHNLKGVVR